MARSSEVHDGSLELLLDVICNTFGSILFLAILVTVMLNSTGTGTPPAAPDAAREEEMLDLQSRIARLQQEQRTLEQARRSEQDAVRSVFAPEFVDAVRRLERERERHIGLARDHAALLKGSAERQAAVNLLVRDRQQLSERVAAARQERADLLQKIARLVNRQETRIAAARELDLPNHHFQYLFLKTGRLTSLRSAAKLAIGNPEEIEYASERGTDYAGPRSGAGVLVSAENASAIDGRLKRYAAREDVLEVRLWPDSFAQWQVLRDRIIALGFHYRLVLCRQDEVRFPLGTRLPGATGQ